jgi:hypothetical protein
VAALSSTGAGMRTEEEHALSSVAASAIQTRKRKCEVEIIGLYLFRQHLILEAQNEQLPRFVVRNPELF